MAEMRFYCVQQRAGAAEGVCSGRQLDTNGTEKLARRLETRC